MDLSAFSVPETIADSAIDISSDGWQLHWQPQQCSGERQ